MGFRDAFGFDSARARTLDRAAEVPQDDPSTHTPNTNPAVGTVGPHYRAGEVAWHAEAWDGWPAGWSTPWYETNGADTWSGFGFGRHDPDAYLGRVSTVMTCVDRNSSQLASFPVYGRRGLADIELPGWARNPLPGLYTDWADFVLECANAMQLDGEAIVWAAERNAAGYPATFMVLPARSVDIEYDRARGRFVYEHAGDELRTRDVCHIRFQRVAGRYRGIGPLEWSTAHLTSAAALEKYATDIARHGLWAVLKHPSNLTPKQRDDAKAGFMAARRAGAAAPAVLSGGWELDTVQLSPTDMALLDLRVLDDQRIAAAFRLQPYLAGIEQPGSMTYDNAQLVGDHHWRIGLRPLAKKLATALSAFLLPGERRIEFNRDEYVEPGFAGRAAAYATMNAIRDDTADGPAMTVAEIRRRERFGSETDEAGEAGAIIGGNP